MYRYIFTFLFFVVVFSVIPSGHLQLSSHYGNVPIMSNSIQYSNQEGQYYIPNDAGMLCLKTYITRTLVQY